MLVLGLFVFLRQYLMDRELVRLLEESRLSLENLQRLQTELVQREKLASLAQLVSGAAHEINNPLAAILGYSELLAAHPGHGTRSGQHGAQDRPAGTAHPGTGLQPAQLCATVAGRKDAAGHGLARATRPANENAAHRTTRTFAWKARLRPIFRKSGATSTSSFSAASKSSATLPTPWRKWVAEHCSVSVLRGGR